MRVLKKENLNPSAFIALSIMASFLISIFFHHIIKSIEEKECRLEFQKKVQQYTFLLQSEIDRNIEILNYYNSFYKASTFVSREEFETFSIPILKNNKTLQAIEWAPLVTSEQRKAFEKGAQKTHPNFMFTEQDDDFNMIPSKEMDVYAPVYYIQPMENNEAVLGYNLYSEEDRRKSMQLAIKENKITATPPIKLIQNAQKNIGILVFKPIKSNNPPYDVDGFYTGVFNIKKLVRKAFAPLSYSKDHITILDTTANKNKLLYGNNFNKIGTEYSYTNNVKIAGRIWQLRITANESAFSYSKYIYIIPIIIFILLLLLSLYLYLLLHKNKDIQNIVAKQTATFLKSKEEAEESNQFKSLFLANMSHEIRTPIGGILSMSEILLSTELGIQQKEYAQNIFKSSNYLLNAVNDILDFTSISDGKLLLEESSCNLKSLIKETCLIFYDKANKQNLDLNLNIDPSIPKNLKADPARLRQILINLLNNAFKFTENGHILVDVSNVKTTLDDCTILIKVQDTGIGIKDEDMKFVFGKFAQVDTSSTRKYEGTGLGLTITKELVHLMGGTISVQSNVGVGSTFIIKLTLKICNETNKVYDFEDIDIEDLKPKNLKILLVEDNAINQKIAQTYLQSMGVSNIDIAYNGIEGVVLYKSKPYDLVFMDCQMPEMDGYEATRKIRTIERSTNHHTPIIAITAKAVKGDREVCIEAGMDDYLTKPYTKKKFYEKLSQWIADKDSA